MKTVLITGAGGFIARHLLPRLKSDGLRVVGVSRSDVVRQGYDAHFPASLGSSIAGVFTKETISAVVHTANDTGPDEYKTNVAGTTQWFREAQGAGVGLQILLSSLSAAPAATTDYGRAKFALEKLFTGEGEISLRLGVVVGDGGMFRKMVEPLRRSPVIPLLDGGKGRIHLLGVDFLADAIARCIANGDAFRGRVLNLQQPSSHSLRDVLDAIRNHYGLRCRFLPVPSLPILWALTVLDRLPLRLPISATNIRGLRQSRNETFPSDYFEFDKTQRSLDELVAAAAAHRL